MDAIGLPDRAEVQTARPPGEAQAVEYARLGRAPTMNVGLVVVLHLLTAGIFSAVWFNAMHGWLPRRRRDDPGALLAIGLLFVPVFNFYWVFFTYLRLCDRIDEERMRAGLPVRSVKSLAVVCCVLLFVPYVNIVSLFTLQPAFFALLQDRVNELAGCD